MEAQRRGDPPKNLHREHSLALSFAATPLCKRPPDAAKQFVGWAVAIVMRGHGHARCFARWLSAPHLRVYLKKRLPDFDDVEAEERALKHAQEHKSLLQALPFLVSWPALNRAASLVIRRAAELDGDHYEILTPAANALAGKHPLAATLVLRSMIDFSLGRSRSSRYQHAARHFMECASLAVAIRDCLGQH